MEEINDDFTDKEFQESRKRARIQVQIIKRQYGIDLSWGEQASLAHYYRCMKRIEERILSDHPQGHCRSQGAMEEASQLFMIDKFGLD